MPRTTYTEDEVAAIVRVAYTTGLRDALISAQGATLSDEQAHQLETFIRDKRKLRATAQEVLRVAGHARSAEMTQYERMIEREATRGDNG